MLGEMLSGQPFQNFDQEVSRAFRRENKPEQQSFGFLTGASLMPSYKAHGGVVPEEGAADIKNVDLLTQALYSKDKYGSIKTLLYRTDTCHIKSLSADCLL